MDGLAIEEIGDLDALTALTPEWWTLWRRCPPATPFQTPAWLLPWWRHFAPGELRTLAVRRQGQLVALAPFYLEDGRLGRRLLPVGISVSDHLDILLDPDCEAAGAAIIRHFARQDDWNCWELEELGAGAAALGLPCPAGHEDACAEQSACPILALSGEHEDIPREIPSDRRRKLRRAWRLAKERGGMEIERVETDPGPFLETLFRLHGERWESRGESGVLTDDPVRRFQREAIARLLDAGLARLYTLRIGSRTAGAYYGLMDRRRAYAYLGGFDPDFAYESPGAILIGHAITEAAREGASAFDFLRGRERYKYQWGAVDCWNRRRSFRKPGR